MNVEDQYMDDLFGDADHHVTHHHITASAADATANTTTPVSKGLAERLDVLASSNCCSKIAWSRFGCIASVAEDGRHVDLRVHMRNPKTGEWRLPKPTELWPSIPEGQKIVHLAYSAMGNDLAVVDSAGRIMLYTTGFTLGSMMPVHTAVNDSQDEQNAVVGLHWLPVFPHTQKTTIFWSVSRRNNDDAWSVKNQQHLTPGPYNPLEGKSALVCLTRKGTLRLLWQARSNQWSETTVELEDAALATSLSFTHASFTPEKDALLFTAHQVRRGARLYQLKIHWNMPVKQEQGEQNQTATPTPALDVAGLLEENAFTPQHLPSLAHDEHDGTGGHHTLEPSYAVQLSKLLFVPPPPPEHPAKDESRHTILAVFAVVPPQGPMLMDASLQWQQATTVVCRWEVHRDLTDKLSPCFDQLSVKKRATSGVQPRLRTRLRRLDDILISPAVLSINPVRNNTMFALTLGDGTVQFRHRATMDVIMPDDSPDEVHSLAQSGFAFQHIDPGLHTALSPGACVVATLSEKGEVGLEKIQYLNGSLAEIGEHESKHDAIAAVIALQYSSACMQYKVTDDLVSILPTNLSSSLSRMIVTLCTRFLNVDFDLLSGDFQKQIIPLFRNHLPFRCFSLQNALGAADKSGPRKLSARLAWITLNLRHVSQNIFFNLRSDQNLKPEMAISFVGLVKWSLDLCSYLLQEIYSIYFAIQHEAHAGRPGREKDRDWIQEQIQKRHSPAILLLLSSMPRVLLRMTFRPLRHGYVHSSNGFKTSLTLEHKGAFHKLLGVYQSAPVNHTSFPPLEEYIGEIDTLIKTAYQSAALTAQQRSALEKDLFLTSSVPSLLMPAVTAMLSSALETLMSRIDPGKIHTHDVSWLGLTDDRRTRSFHEGHTIDVIRKMPLASSVKLRVCPRCGSVMEDLAQGPSHQQPWVWQSHKVCVCFSSWASPEAK